MTGAHHTVGVAVAVALGINTADVWRPSAPFNLFTCRSIYARVIDENHRGGAPVGPYINIIELMNTLLHCSQYLILQVTRGSEYVIYYYVIYSYGMVEVLKGLTSL